jgi:hypothetical protein
MELRRGPFEIEVDGHHTLRIRSGRYSSHEGSFDVADGEVVDFRARGPLVWPLYVALIFKPDLGIWLKSE